MPCEDGGKTFPTGTVRTINNVESVCAADGEWVPVPDIGPEPEAANPPKPR